MGGEASPELKGAAKDEGYKLRVSLPIPCRSELFPRCHAELVLHCYFESILYCSELFYIVILSRRRRISRVLIIVSSPHPFTLSCLPCILNYKRRFIRQWWMWPFTQQFLPYPAQVSQPLTLLPKIQVRQSPCLTALLPLLLAKTMPGFTTFSPLYLERIVC